MGLAETAELSVRIGLDDNLSPGLRKINGQLGKFSGGVKRTGRGVGELAGGLARVGAVAAGAAAVGIAASVKWAGDFESQLNTINTIAQETPKNLTAIGDGIRKIARETGITTEELTASYYDLLSAGIKAADAQSVLNNAVTLGIGALGTTTETVDLLTTAYNAYGLDAKGAAIATDQFAKAVEDGKVKASEIAATFANVASVAKGAGIGIEQIAASFAYLTAQGVPAAEVTTEMNRAIIELLKPNKALLGLQNKLGKSYAAIARKKGLVPALQEMRKDAKKAGVAFQDLFGRLEGYKFALQTTGPEFKKFMAEQARILNSSGTAIKQAAERQKGFNYSMSVLTANVKDAGITIGSYLLPPLAELAQKAAAFLRRDDVQKKLKDIGEGLAKAVRGIDFDKLVTAASGFARTLEPALKTLLKIGELISKLPPELLGAGGALVITNKITGGLLLKGAGDVFGGLAESLTKGLATKIPIFGKAFVQPVFVTNKGFGSGGVPGGAPTGGKGGIGGIAKTVGGLILVGAVAEIADAVKPLVTGAGQSIHQAIVDAFDIDIKLPIPTASEMQWPFGPKNTPTILPEIFGGNGVLGGTGETKLPGAGTGTNFTGGRGGPAGGMSTAKLEQKTDAVKNAVNSTKTGVVASQGKIDRSVQAGRSATHAAGERTRAALDAVKAKQQASIVAFRAGERATLATKAALGAKLGTANERLAQIRAKRTHFTTNTYVNVNTRVSVSEMQRQARYTSRVARTTRLSAS